VRGHRVAIALAASVLLWLPTMSKLLDGTIDVSTAGVLWLVGLWLSMVGVQLVGKLVAGYGPQPELPEEPAGQEARGEADAAAPTSPTAPAADRRNTDSEPESHPLRRKDDEVDEVVG
jgi:hypothetical protein